jgi:hypothetical protein
MDAWVWVVIAVAIVIVVLGVIWFAMRGRESRALKNRFGPEYDRVAADAPTKRDAEAELREREARHEEFDIRPLDDAARADYGKQWEDVQARFVDDPGVAVAQADSLIQNVMRDRGYPVEDFDTRAADLSVEHPDVVENYRAGHGIATAYERGSAGTEELRQAVKHYRALFAELVDAREKEEVRK